MRGKRIAVLFGMVTLVTASVLSGCFARARFYPVQGPLSAQTPPPVFAGKLTVNANFRSGTFTAVLKGGETFKGTLSLVRTSQKNRMGQTVETTPPMARGMDADWDLVYGQGYYLAHVLGEGQYGRAEMTGSHGTQLQIEIHSAVSREGSEIQTSQPKGVAKDSNGNLYKVVIG